MMKAAFTNEKIEKAYSLLSAASSEGYKDIFLLSNQVLSKNPFASNFVNYILKDEPIKPYRRCGITSKVSLYYVKSFGYFFLYLLRFVEFFLANYRFRISAADKELILIDTYFVMGRISKQNTFSDMYFTGLEALLRKKGKHYAYLPGFHNNLNDKRMGRLYQVLRILKKDKTPVLCEYQLLSPVDLMRIVYFIIAYPFRVLGFARKLSPDNYENRLLKHELMDKLGMVTFHNFSRYLQGRRIAKLPYAGIKVVSWYENQPMHKNLYAGLRTTVGKVKIYGAQFFIAPKNYMFAIPDESEEAFGVIPDKIIVNGPYFVPEGSRLPYVPGPSMRNARIFKNHPAKKERKILVLLSYFPDETENVLNVLSKADLGSWNIVIKPHPSMDVRKFGSLIPSNMLLADDDIYKLFETTKIVMGAASGSLIEAASSQIPVIVVKNPQDPGYHDFFPSYGRGIIWEEVSGPEALSVQLARFEGVLDGDPQNVKTVADRYRDAFFCDFREEDIMKVFDL